MITELINFGQQLKNFVVSGEGNISFKYNETGNFIIKASGCDLYKLTHRNIILCDKAGKQLNNFDEKPSMETGFHAWLLQNNNINFIAHTHPTNTLKILCSGLSEEFANTRLFPDQVVRNNKKSCVVPYATPGNKLLDVMKKSLSVFCDQQGYFPSLILLENHGIICAGKDAKSCLMATEICEKSAEIFFQSKMFGNLNKLTDIQIDEILNCPMEKHRREK